MNTNSGVRDMVPWNELRPPGCSCRSWYERDTCCEACEPVEPTPVQHNDLLRVAGPPTAILVVAAVVLLIVFLRSHG